MWSPGRDASATRHATPAAAAGALAPLIGRRTRMLQLVMAVTSISLMFWSLRFTD
ncbi:MAG: hypothetical protein JNL26_03520 [Gemmatimonadetes bacterium]|nr:hypothetical protein [Gemmatimonadota bacterium]